MKGPWLRNDEYDLPVRSDIMMGPCVECTRPRFAGWQGGLSCAC